MDVKFLNHRDTETQRQISRLVRGKGTDHRQGYPLHVSILSLCLGVSVVRKLDLYVACASDVHHFLNRLPRPTRTSRVSAARTMALLARSFRFSSSCGRNFWMAPCTTSPIQRAPVPPMPARCSKTTSS